MLILNADGGCWPNPGPATFGVVAKRDGVVVARLKESIGHATNNIAEWRGAIAALQYALDTRAMAVELRMDSQLVVHQLNGKWGVKNERLKPYVEQGKTLLARLRRDGAQVLVKWVPREQNTEADALTTSGSEYFRPSAPARPPTLDPLAEMQKELDALDARYRELVDKPKSKRIAFE